MKSENGCPFCHQTVIKIIKSSPPAMKGFQAECDNCGARGPIYNEEKEALTGWEHGISDRGGRLRNN